MSSRIQRSISTWLARRRRVDAVRMERGASRGRGIRSSYGENNSRTVRMGPAKIFLITGANSGLGLCCVKELLKRNPGCTVILACRNLDHAKKVQEHVLKGAPPSFKADQLVVLDIPLDLSDCASVRNFVHAVKSWLGDERKLDVLINNAGIGGNKEFRKNSDGNDLIFSTNHLGHFLLTLLLLPVIKERIVNVTSEVHDPEIKHGLPNPQTGWPKTDEDYERKLLKGEPLPKQAAVNAGLLRYSRSKLCNIFFTNELARRISGDLPAFVSGAVAETSAGLPSYKSCTLEHVSSIRVVAYNPGMMLDTQFVSSSAGSTMARFAQLLRPILKFTAMGKLIRAAKVSGRKLAYLANGDIEGGATAQFFDADLNMKPSSKFSLSSDGFILHSLALWNNSIKWCQLTQQELQEAGFFL